jgi:hypothetical protein
MRPSSISSVLTCSAVRGQAVLQIDAGERRRELTQVSGRRAHQAGELAEAPMGWRDWRVGAGQHQREALGVVAAGFYSDRCALHGPGPAALGPATHGREQLREGQIPLVRWP